MLFELFQAYFSALAGTFDLFRFFARIGAEWVTSIHSKQDGSDR
jgi:hypothetical protein